VLKDFKLVFNYPGYPLVEPAFANLKPSKGSEVHGVAFAMSKASMERMDSIEPEEYTKKKVTLQAYDGRELNGFVYYFDKSSEEKPPSERYMSIIVTGARNAGLKEDYLTWLQSLETYKVPEWVKKVRLTRPRPDQLREVTLKALNERNGKDGRKPW